MLSLAATLNFNLLQADYGNNFLRRLNLPSGLVTTIAGSLSGTVGVDNAGFVDGQSTAASFNRPIGIAISNGGTFAIVVSNELERWTFKFGKDCVVFVAPGCYDESVIIVANISPRAFVLTG